MNTTNIILIAIFIIELLKMLMLVCISSDMKKFISVYKYIIQELL